MFEAFLKRQSDVFYIQIWPERFKATELNSLQRYDDAALIAYERDGESKIVRAVGASSRSLENTPNTHIVNPFYGRNFVFEDMDCAVAIINHALFTLMESLPNKVFAPLLIFHPMCDSKDELGLTVSEAKKLFVKRCGAKKVIIMAPDEYLDVEGV